MSNPVADQAASFLLDRYKAKCSQYNAQRAEYEAKYAECTSVVGRNNTILGEGGEGF